MLPPVIKPKVLSTPDPPCISALAVFNSAISVQLVPSHFSILFWVYDGDAPGLIPLDAIAEVALPKPPK